MDRLSIRENSGGGDKIVTAFFDIGRESFAVYPRTKSEYFQYFRFWSRIRNEMIVFCGKEDAEEIRAIRRDFGLEEDKTKIIVIDDIYCIEPEIFLGMCAVETSETFKNFRYYSIACSNTAKYNYIMLLKYYFLAKATELSSEGQCDNFVWVDFGFNHGGRYYLIPQEFDFEWKWECRADVEIFCLSDPDNMSIIDSLQFQKDCIQGTIVGCKRNSAGRLWEWMQEAMRSLLLMECMDDDQHLLLMVYKAHKEKFHTTICDWYQPMELSTEHIFTTREKQGDGHAARDLAHLEKFLDRVRRRTEQYY